MALERPASRTLIVAALALFGSSVAERPKLTSSVLQKVEVKAHGYFHKQEAAANTSSPDCLCSFDIDRTMTGKQGETRTCSSNKVIRGVHDNAYDRGDLTLSELGQHIGKTFCKRCYIAFVSAGNAGGKHSKERATLVRMAEESGGTLISKEWSGCSRDKEHRCNCAPHARLYPSTLVVGCKDGTKQEAIKGILANLKEAHGVAIDKSRVFHFDDREENIVSFEGTGFNSRQISCKHMDGHKGLCGARLREIEESVTGLNKCPAPMGCDPGGPIWGAHAGAGGRANTCGGRIEWVRDHDGLLDDEARARIAKEFPDECAMCAPHDPQVVDNGDGGDNNPDGDGNELSNGADESEQPDYEKFDGKMPHCGGSGDPNFEGPKEMSPDACKSWCTESEDCECVAYKKSKRKCYLVKKCSKDTWDADKHFAIYYKLVRGAETKGDPRYKTHYNTKASPAHGGQDLGLAPKENMAPEDCMAWCSEVAKCECASYRVSEKKCWLRTQCTDCEWADADGYNVFEQLERSPSENPAPSGTPALMGTPSPSGVPSPSGSPGGPAGCKTATLSNGMEGCYRAADWARSTGVVKHPDAYKPLTASSPFENFQDFLYRDGDQQGCTVQACDPPPQQPGGVSVRITPALASRGYGKLRVSLVRYAGRPPADSGDVKWTYSKQFQHRWEGCHLKSAIVHVTPGQPKTLNMDGIDVTVKLPKKDDGIVALFMADPKYDKGQGARWKVLGVTQDIINGMHELDYWSTVGDNWYDASGQWHKQVFRGLNLNGSQRLFSATMGNHDYIIRSLHADGLSGDANKGDSFGYGHVQWYALDTIAAKEDPAQPFNWKYKPWKLVDKSNTFFYHSVGNVFMIGFSNNFGWKQQESWFHEACQHAGKANPVLVLLLGHWDGANGGCRWDSTTQRVRDNLEKIPGCKGKRIKGIMGHSHKNQDKGKVWLIGGWGFDWRGDSDHRFGLPFLDTRGGKIRFIWFKLVQPGQRIDKWDTIRCLKEKGIDGCLDKPKEVWYEESI